MSFDTDYGPYRGDPRDPRYDDSEEVARDDWECEATYLDKIGAEAIEEILGELQSGSIERARADLIRAIDGAWDAKKQQDRQEEYDDERD